MSEPRLAHAGHDRVQIMHRLRAVETGDYTALERHLLTAMQTIRGLAARNAQHHTGFVHISRVADAWLEDREREE